MRLYLYDRRFYYTGSIKVSVFDTRSARSTKIRPPAIPAGKAAVFRGNLWTIEDQRTPDPERVPRTATAEGLRLALYADGLLDAVDTWAARQPRRDIRWRYRGEFEREDDFTAELQALLTLSDADVDVLFIKAGRKDG